MYTSGERVVVLHGKLAGRHGVVIAQVGHEESLLLEIKLRGEPNTTMHRMALLVKEADVSQVELP